MDWVIKIAHLICNPCSAGQVYTHTTGSLSDWFLLDRDPSWWEVVQGDPLHPGIYEFDTAGPIVLSKISKCKSHSQTSLIGSDSLEPNATTFLNQIRQRDGNRCVVTGAELSLVASHLIPKCLGTDGAKGIVTRFSGEQAAQDINKFDPRIMILLSDTLDTLVDLYDLGFYHVGDIMVSYHIELSIVLFTLLPLYLIGQYLCSL